MHWNEIRKLNSKYANQPAKTQQYCDTISYSIFHSVRCHGVQNTASIIQRNYILRLSCRLSNSSTKCSKSGVGNLLHLQSQISPFVTIRNPARAAKLPSGRKTSLIPQMIPKRRSLFTSKRSHNWGFKEPHVTLEPQVL